MNLEIELPDELGAELQRGRERKAFRPRD